MKIFQNNSPPVLYFSIFLFLTSCSIEKRLHLSGYSIDWKNGNMNSSEINSTLKRRNHSDEIYKTVTTSVGFILGNENKLKFENECDSVILRNGKEISAKISEVTSKQIKYKLCDYPNGPTYIVENEKIRMIKYANGLLETFEEIKSDTIQQPVNPAAQENEKIQKIEYSSYKKDTLEKKQSETIQYSANPVLQDKASKPKVLNDLEKCSKAEIEAEKRETYGWVFVGLACGLFGILFAALIKPRIPDSSELSKDPTYIKCYQKRIRKKSMLSALAGWLFFLGVYLIIVLNKTEK